MHINFPPKHGILEIVKSNIGPQFIWHELLYVVDNEV